MKCLFANFPIFLKPRGMLASAVLLASFNVSALVPASQAAPSDKAKSETKAAPQSGSEALDDLEALQKKLGASDFLSVDFKNSFFKKSIRQSMKGKATVTSGKAFFAKPALFRWEVTERKNCLIYDGTSFFQYYPETSSATEIQQTQEFNAITKIFLSFDQLKKNYRVDSLERKGETTMLKLSPLMQSDISEALVEVDEGKNFIHSLKLSYRNGERSDITFSNPSRTAIASAKFELPKGTKITKL